MKNLLFNILMFLITILGILFFVMVIATLIGGCLKGVGLIVILVLLGAYFGGIIIRHLILFFVPIFRYRLKAMKKFAENIGGTFKRSWNSESSIIAPIDNGFFKIKLYLAKYRMGTKISIEYQKNKFEPFKIYSVSKVTLTKEDITIKLKEILLDFLVLTHYGVINNFEVKENKIEMYIRGWLGKDYEDLLSNQKLAFQYLKKISEELDCSSEI